jgi:anti-sigma B factor antagonist
MAANFRHIEVTDNGIVTYVRLRGRKIIDKAEIEELGAELFSLVEKHGYRRLALNWSGVEFLSSSALNKLIILDKKVKAHGGTLQHFQLLEEVYQVFCITRLNRLFVTKSVMHVGPDVITVVPLYQQFEDQRDLDDLVLSLSWLPGNPFSVLIVDLGQIRSAYPVLKSALIKLRQEQEGNGKKLMLSSVGSALEVGCSADGFEISGSAAQSVVTELSHAL